MLSNAVELSRNPSSYKINWPNVVKVMNNGRDIAACHLRWKRVLLSKIVDIPKIDFWFPDDVINLFYFI